ncbi:hypothetical protein [Tenacibaculum sp. M341]|uniref:hypothetical protein n=1 Tax=Tenacibaculum sp. M341 TaxID=2530339 RepID=UPI0010469348|nr:hypothetical protein [Tenacibaculum sp. M341]TCI84377.1 hypothetical protein EYW44_21740 [Tenacibaculum sp. M341]
MKQQEIISKKEFIEFYEPLLKAYSENFKKEIASQDFMCDLLFAENDEINISKIHNIIETHKDVYIKSFLYRLLGTREIIFCRENDLLFELKEVWKLISNSIRLIPSTYIISSIGSQGFLSIPLYKKDEKLENFDFLRLHIWDDSLDEYMDLKKVDDFSIHSHTFFAKSWVITGKIINDRFEYIKDSKKAKHSFFKVVYNDSLNEVNQHTSKAVNKKIDAELIKISEELHLKNAVYEIKPSKLHKSGHKNSPKCSATFFSFTGKDGLGESFVIGPKSINESEVNRKMNIAPQYLLDKIDSQL